MVCAGGGGRAHRACARARWSHAAAEPARYLLVMTPRIHQLIEALHSGARDDWAAIFEEYDSELLS